MPPVTPDLKRDGSALSRIGTNPRCYTKHRRPKSVAPLGRFLLSRFPRATATKWRTREKRPATSPSALRTHFAHARARLPAAAGTLPVTSRGVANQECGRNGRGVRGSRSLPLSWRRFEKVEASAVAGTPFLGRPAPPGALRLPGFPSLAGKQLDPRGSGMSKTCSGNKAFNALAESPAKEACH